MLTELEGKYIMHLTTGRRTRWVRKQRDIMGVQYFGEKGTSEAGAPGTMRIANINRPGTPAMCKVFMGSRTTRAPAAVHHAGGEVGKK